MDKEYFFKTDQLVIWRPSGILDTVRIKEFIGFIDVNTEQRDPHFSRFIDLSQISGISVNYEDVVPIVQQRKSYSTNHIKRKVKMAFLVHNPISFGMARMYQMLYDDPLFEINIYESREEVSDYLEVDVSILVP
ncbi:MAG: hypothetical protein GQ561_02925 [Calditrichae bacterium]|nr:hypothetical protein [Calditrichia bacterium]